MPCDEPCFKAANVRFEGAGLAPPLALRCRRRESDFGRWPVHPFGLVLARKYWIYTGRLVGLLEAGDAMGRADRPHLRPNGSRSRRLQLGQDLLVKGRPGLFGVRWFPRCLGDRFGDSMLMQLPNRLLHRDRWNLNRLRGDGWCENLAWHFGLERSRAFSGEMWFDRLRCRDYRRHGFRFRDYRRLGFAWRSDFLALCSGATDCKTYRSNGH